MENCKIMFPRQHEVALQTYPLEEIADDEILIRSLVSQISTGTELTNLDGNVEPGTPWANSIKYPINSTGYSTVGQVIAVGKDVSPDLIGKRVFVSRPHRKYHICKADQYDGLMWIPENVDTDDAVFTTMATITNGSIRYSGIRPGDACVVYGAGIIGQMVARMAYAAGSTKIFVVDTSDLRLNCLPENSCYIKVNPTTVDVAQFVKSNTIREEGVPFVFETTGVPSVIPEELNCLCRLGTLVITSSPRGKSLIDLDFVNRKGIRILGAHNYTVHPDEETRFNCWTRRRDSDYFLELLKFGRITAKEMNTHRFHYTDAVAAYQMLQKDRSQALSVLIDWED